MTDHRSLLCKYTIAYAYIYQAPKGNSEDYMLNYKNQLLEQFVVL